MLIHSVCVGSVNSSTGNSLYHVDTFSLLIYSESVSKPFSEVQCVDTLCDDISYLSTEHCLYHVLKRICLLTLSIYVTLSTVNKHSLNHSLISFTESLTESFTESLTESLTESPTESLTESPTGSLL